MSDITTSRLRRSIVATASVVIILETHKLERDHSPARGPRPHRGDEVSLVTELGPRYIFAFSSSVSPVVVQELLQNCNSCQPREVKSNDIERSEFRREAHVQRLYVGT